jgi:hypothetical protein
MTLSVETPWTKYRETAKAVEERFPDLWAKCYPRRYDETGKAQYDSPKAVARAMMDALINYHAAYITGSGPGTTEQAEALWASTMVRFLVPTYYLSHDIAVAMTQTTPAEVLDAMAIKLPFEAAAFMLPKGILTHADYGGVSFVAYTRRYGGTSILCPGPNPKSELELCAPENMFIFTVFLRTVHGQTLHWSYDSELRLVDLKNEAELVELQKNYSHTSSVYSAESQSFTGADIAAMTRAIKLVFNIVLLMTHKPEMVESARLLKRVKKGAGAMIEYWKPHIIGRSYKLRYEHHGSAGDGTHASPRGHWVSGFWREQAYGEKRSLHKTLWIEPFWRGGRIE